MSPTGRPGTSGPSWLRSHLAPPPAAQNANPFHRGAPHVGASRGHVSTPQPGTRVSPASPGHAHREGTLCRAGARGRRKRAAPAPSPDARSGDRARDGERAGSGSRACGPRRDPRQLRGYGLAGQRRGLRDPQAALRLEGRTRGGGFQMSASLSALESLSAKEPGRGSGPRLGVRGPLRCLPRREGQGAQDGALLATPPPLGLGARKTTGRGRGVLLRQWRAPSPSSRRSAREEM